MIGEETVFRVKGSGEAGMREMQVRGEDETRG
jgi:hypothetical protein